MPKYDDAEARRILARTAGKLISQSKEKYEESVELLKSLVALNGLGGFAITVQGATVEVQLGPRLATVRYGVSEGFVVFDHEGHAFPVALRFNPVLNQFEGETEDTFRAPQPGEPTPQRSALAVLVGSICTVLGG